jgi:hypothetical protein
MIYPALRRTTSSTRTRSVETIVAGTPTDVLLMVEDAREEIHMTPTRIVPVAMLVVASGLHCSRRQRSSRHGYSQNSSRLHVDLLSSFR